MKRKRLPVVQSRTCGECFACCYVFGIPALDKVAGRDCAHLDRSKGAHHCTTYDARPADCVQYSCAWVHDDRFGSDEHRPDKLGVVLTPRDNKREVIAFAGPVTLVAHETRPGAFAEEAVHDFLERVAERIIVLGFHGPRLDKCRAMGPADRLSRALTWCTTHRYANITGILNGTKPDLLATLLLTC